MILFWAAISLGFLGSFHCVGMCGPIALALPIGQLNSVQRFFSVLLYNFGRMFTYAIFGLIFGALGKSFALFGYQQALSITLGILILLGLFLPKKIISKWSITSSIYTFFNKLKTKLSSLFSKEGKKTLFLIGILNGLLPCGLVYMAVAGAIATSDILKGSIFMAVFGLGTFPVMIALPYFGNRINLTFRNKIRKVVPVFLGVMAVLLIVRGLNLGIPYLSPQHNFTKSEIPTCHTVAGNKICWGSNHQ
ncbi:sulfite exporter TauE/SafE family protein [Aurantibacillus circumpalustris]|uniref:sulfite exporter TauE/SafE family protein n=1 Tax=Aurantibacillus circumpalustris TaxID=3036359 RepID=UPI00295BAB5C|nr:sulfite exporter TauE/SafE family protein [Aurantibacillus circumpalustris]